MDSIVALLEGVDEPDDVYADAYNLNRPLRRFRTNEEEQ
jgi:hypothetical protein